MAIRRPIASIQTLARAALASAMAVGALLGGCGEGPAAASPTAEKDSAAGGGMAWRSDYRAALSEASESVKPVLIDFYTEWCGFCKRMDGEAFKDAEVLRIAEGFVTLKVDAEKDPALASRFGVRAYPTFLFLSPRGITIRSVEGYMAPGAFAEEMRRALAEAGSRG